MLGVEAGGRGHHARRTRRAPGRGRGFQRRAPRRAAGHVHLRVADRRRANRHDAFGFGGPRLSRGRARARLLAEQHRAEYTAVSDEAALDAARTLARREGIIPALESAHALGGTDRSRAAHAPRRNCDPESFRARRQGHGDSGALPVMPHESSEPHSDRLRRPRASRGALRAAPQRARWAWSPF